MNEKLTRDKVLDAFGAAGPFPTEALVREWTKKYPQFERDIVDFATEWASAVLNTRSSKLNQECEDVILNRTMSRVQKLVRELHGSTAAVPSVTPLGAGTRFQIDSLEEALCPFGAGPSWLEAFGIDESIMALFDARLIDPPVPRRLLEGLARGLGVHVEAFREWLFQESTPFVTSYASKTPSFERWSFRQAVEESTLPESMKQDWLRELP